MIDLLLRSPLIYELHNRLFNARANQRRLLQTLQYQCGMKVLDIGCGTGQSSKLFQPGDYTGIDVSEAYIERARKKYQGSFHVLKAGELTTLDKKFDAAFVLGVLHHLSDDEVLATFRGLEHVLPAQGRLVVFEAVWPSRWYDLPGWALRRLDRGAYVRTRWQWLGLLRQTGWHVAHESMFRNRLLQHFVAAVQPSKAAQRRTTSLLKRRSA